MSLIVASRPKLLVCWGAGQNRHDSNRATYPSVLNEFDLVGIRDHSSPFEWVPCASCLNPLFDKRYETTEEVVLYNHTDYPGLQSQGMPEMNNTEVDLRKVVQFLASGETVLTTSYHGAYWATLLGKKVVVVNPFSSKFFTFRHPVTISDSSEWKAAAKKAVAYPQALDECRESNYSFARKIQERIGELGGM